MQIGHTSIRLRSAHRLTKPVTWLELFFDLVFVAAVAQVGEPLAHDFSLSGIVRYAFLFFLIWWAWLGHSMFNTRFLVDDPLQRLFTLVQIFATAVMAANARDALSSRDAAGFSAAYAVVRIVLVIQYLRARKVPGARVLAGLYASGYGIAAIFWVAAALAPASLRYALWSVALAIDIATPVLSARYTHKFPPDAEHLPERFGLFTIILLGDSVMSIMHGIESQETWAPQAALSAFFGLCLTFMFWWCYFDQSGVTREKHVRSRIHARSLEIWQYVHLPLYLSLAVVGVGIERVIAAGGRAPLPSDAVILLATANSVALFSIAVLSIASNETFHRRFHWLSPVLALLPIYPATRATPAYLLLGYFLAVCALQTLLAKRTPARLHTTASEPEFNLS
jgi:low temperature requirement protein LtrA